MSFSDQRKKCFKLGNATGFSNIEKSFFKTQENPPINENYAVEILVDRIRSTLCNFQFKESLNDAFSTAKDHALNCIELGYHPSPAKYKHWITDCLKCTDCILFVYMRDILKQKVTGAAKEPKERDIYNLYIFSSEADLKKVGSHHNNAYTLRNRFEHHRIVTINGRQEIHSMSVKLKIEKYKLFRNIMRESLDIMMSRFRKAFPRYCTN